MLRLLRIAKQAGSSAIAATPRLLRIAKQASSCPWSSARCWYSRPAGGLRSERKSA